MEFIISYFPNYKIIQYTKKRDKNINLLYFGHIQNKIVLPTLRGKVIYKITQKTKDFLYLEIFSPLT